MAWSALITLGIIFLALILFVSEIISIDLVALLIMSSLILSGVISLEEGLAGFSNSATITVLFMFILSAALLKTGALQNLAQRLSPVFRYNYRLGMFLMMLMIAFISAFINNTPVVAVFIPVIIQIAQASGQSPSKMLIPLSFASIFGGTCTLIGTSTNVLVSGIAESHGIAPFSMFTLAPVGIFIVASGIIYMLSIGMYLLPQKVLNQDLNIKFGVGDYLTEIELMENSDSVGKKIMDAPLVKELELDIIKINRKNSTFNLPPGDFVLQAEDVLKVRSNVEKIKTLKDRLKILPKQSLKVAGAELNSSGSTLVELVITANSSFTFKTLKDLDFRRKYRAVPLAIRHREEVLHENLYDSPLKAGDIIFAEVKSHYIRELKKMEQSQDAPFVLLSEDPVIDFDRKKFGMVSFVLIALVLSVSLHLVPIALAAILSVCTLALLGCLEMKEAYEAVNWKIIFLLAGALSLGTAMQNSELDHQIADSLILYLGDYNVYFLIGGLYLVTSLLTELMSNNATAALMAPIAIAISAQLGLEPLPFLVCITLASSASFMTPIGYQTNTMVYSAGQYRFRDFIKVGFLLNLLTWILATLLIPQFYNF